MLRAIELVGFKSFADRTRFEFDGGITAIVGPNGSGKSNVVDAIKWVLGEQSMKKLRSSDSTDVIFSGAAGRSALGSAEVTLTFDNSHNVFRLDTSEVHITRRVYRSGEGEYLINRQAVRLKDIKDILSGTGLGTQAYCIIEQGRVETMLQSSAIQRRVLFDEAAGISRFYAQKQEIQRRFERVEPRLLRIADKVNEIEHQLKQTRSQAGKAQLYQQYRERLQTLRIHVGLNEYRQHAERYQTLQGEIAALTESCNTFFATVEEHEKNFSESHAEVEKIDQEIRRIDRELATVKQKIAGEELTIESQAAQVEELELEMSQHGQQLIERTNKNAGIESQIRKLTEDQRRIQRQATDAAESHRKLLEQEAVLSRQCKEQQQERDSLRKEIEAKNRQSAKLAGTISGLDSQLTASETRKTQDADRLEKLGKQNADWARQCDELHEVVEQLRESVLLKEQQLGDAKKRKSSRLKQLSELNKKLSEQKQKQSGMKERMSLLEELIRKHEGVSQGVREVLQQASDPQSPFRHAFGLVADLLRVDFETASLIELALGTNAQHIVVSPKAELFRHIEKNAANFAGRVGFIWLDASEQEAPWMRDPGFAGRPGVLGRADQFVQTERKFTHLARRLLGRTWIVQNIAVAKKLYQESDDRTSFLTVAGEMLTPDGALMVGPQNAVAGLITRRSELRNLTEQIEMLNRETAETELAVTIAQEHLTGGEIEVEEESRDHQKAAADYETQKHVLSNTEDRYRHGLEQYRHLEAEIVKLDSQSAKTTEELTQAKSQRELLEEQLSALEIKQIENKQRLEDTEKIYGEHRETTANAKVELAKSEHKLESHQERIRQLEELLKEQQVMLSEHRKRSRLQKDRQENMSLAILRLESALASLYLQKETLAKQATSISADRQQATALRTKQQTSLKKVQRELDKVRDKIHTKELELERCTQAQKQVVDRLQEDYGIDITKEMSGGRKPAGDSAEPQFLDCAEKNQKEIEDLRNKLSQLGNVNLEAMETLDDLEKQYTAYSSHYNDLILSKKMCEKDFEHVDEVNKQVFMETFEGVRMHFQTLFQKLFGGGSADLVLDNPENILESGVEIIAKPPGKELKNVMLLSGGEKTLTCFALLLAFFRNKPSPVCILDECDAALDEANIDRYNGMLKEFGTGTQFLMITHNKKSMSFATSLYGITMQESGVSKLVSVRYVDVGENGEILRAA
ncbi:MAG: chromosome segregation protein SMC [Planctomycetaceae bacterium]|nr:chromosome segregation protein SMC [Planctomycetaceae bacterium]